MGHTQGKHDFVRCVGGEVGDEFGEVGKPFYNAKDLDFVLNLNEGTLSDIK